MRVSQHPHSHSHLSSVMMNKLVAVSLHHERKLRGGERAVDYPVGQLVMPDTVVSAQQLAVRLREVRDHIAVRERECPLGGLSRVLMVFKVVFRQRRSSCVKK